MKSENFRNINSVSAAIRKLQAASPDKKATYCEEVKKQFNLDSNEKWVISKLRMILFRMDAKFEKFQIQNLKMSAAGDTKKVSKTLDSHSLKRRKLMNSKKFQEVFHKNENADYLLSIIDIHPKIMNA